MPRAAWYFLKFANVSSSYGNNIAKSPWWYLKQQTVSLKKVFIKALQRSQIRGGKNFSWRATANHTWTFYRLSSAYFIIHKALPKML